MVKLTSLIPAAMAMGGALAAPGDKTGTAINRHLFDKRQLNIIGQFTKPFLNPKGGKVPDPPGAASKFVEMEPRVNNLPGARTVKVRYGPYNVPNMKVKNIVGEEGTLWNFPDNWVKKPCDECYIVGMNAGLEWPNGKNANINQGMWLHHMVMLTIGPGRRDPTCAKNGFSLPHLIVGSGAVGSERVFSSGNERTQAILPNWGIKDAGYKMKKSDQLALIVDLMNDTMEDQVVYMTLTFDFVPVDTKGIYNMRPVWFDIAQCLTSDYGAMNQNGSFTIEAPRWVADFEGEIVGMAGHLHDGGENVKIYVDGKEVCNSEATYAGNPEFISPMEHVKGSATHHIEKMSLCINDRLGIKELKKGQSWVLKAHYDYQKNKGDLNDAGKQEPIMGIAIMYVKVKE